MSSWYLETESRVFSLIKSYTEDEIKKLYPSILFTTIDQLPTNSTYSHVVYIHELGGVEKGADLEGDVVNAYESTFEVKVSVTQEDKISKMDDARRITGIITEAFKKLRFQAVSMPNIVITAGAYTVPMRFRRIIGANNTL